MIKLWRFPCLVALITFSLLASAQTYPSKPIRMIVPFPAGGSTDLAARALGQKLSEALGTPVLVDNRPGASGNIGIEAAARATPDGYTLLMGISTLAINPAMYKKVTYDAIKDFAPISLVVKCPKWAKVIRDAGIGEQ